MSVCAKLHDDPTVRVMLWCLLGNGQLTESSLREFGLSRAESQAIMRDEEGLLRRMRMRYAISRQITVADLAALLRERLSHHIENAQKSSELSSLLRCLAGLPDWIFPEWEKAQIAASAEPLLPMALSQGVVPQRA
ncbi:MAG: hypothetical protein R3F46_07765 [bacterium]|nr:hypothetical protein [bacterium]